MPYVVYKSKVRKRTTKQGKDEYYVDVGVFETNDSMRDAIEWTEHYDTEDAELAWDAHCYKMKKQWPRRAGMDVVEKKKYNDVSNGILTIDGSHLKIEVDRNEKPPTLF